MLVCRECWFKISDEAVGHCDRCDRHVYREENRLIERFYCEKYYWTNEVGYALWKGWLMAKAGFPLQAIDAVVNYLTVQGSSI